VGGPNGLGLAGRVGSRFAGSGGFWARTKTGKRGAVTSKRHKQLAPAGPPRQSSAGDFDYSLNKTRRNSERKPRLHAEGRGYRLGGGMNIDRICAGIASLLPESGG